MPLLSQLPIPHWKPRDQAHPWHKPCVARLTWQPLQGMTVMWQWDPPIYHPWPVPDLVQLPAPHPQRAWPLQSQLPLAPHLLQTCWAQCLRVPECQRLLRRENP